MAIGAFTDRLHQPTMEEIRAAIGSKRRLWENLTSLIADTYRLKSDFAFYGKNYGWALRFRKAGKALLSLYPGQESFIAQIIVSQVQTEKALSSGLSKKAGKIIQDAYPYPEGRWLFIKVESEQDMNDVKQLLIAKAQPAQERKSR